MRHKQPQNKCHEQPATLQAQVLVDCHGLPLRDVLARRSERLGHRLAGIAEGSDGELSVILSLTAIPGILTTCGSWGERGELASRLVFVLQVLEAVPEAAGSSGRLQYLSRRHTANH